MISKNEMDDLMIHNKDRLIKYDLFKEFEKKHLNDSFYQCLKNGFSQENPKIKYTNFLRYHFLHFTFLHKMTLNDLNLLAVQKNEIGLIFLNLYSIAQSIEEVNPRDIQDWFMLSYVSLEKISNNAKEEILDFFRFGLLKKSQQVFFYEILEDFDRRYKAFVGTYEIREEPYFHFKLITF